MNEYTPIIIPDISEFTFTEFLSLTVDVKLVNDISSINKITVVEQFFLSDSDNRIQALYLIEKLGHNNLGYMLILTKIRILALLNI